MIEYKQGRPVDSGRSRVVHTKNRVRLSCRETGGIITNYREKIRGHVRRVILLAVLLLLSACRKQDEFTWALVPPEGCEGVVVSGEGESEIVRYDWNGEWVVISRQGFFDASTRGAALLTVSMGGKTYSLEQFYEPLYRPDIIEAMLEPPPEEAAGATSQSPDGSAIAPGPPDIALILKEGNTPTVDVATEGELLRISALDNGSGVGKLLLFSSPPATTAPTPTPQPSSTAVTPTTPPTSTAAAPPPTADGTAFQGGTPRGDAPVPLALYDAAALPSRQTESGQTVYELVIPRAQWDAAYGGTALAVSAFDARFGIESPRLAIPSVFAEGDAPVNAGAEGGASTGSETPEPGAEAQPALHVFAPAASIPEELAAFFTRQEQGRLYSAVHIHSPGDFDLSKVHARDTFILFAGAPSLPDNTGDFTFQFGREPWGKWQVLAQLFATPSRRALIFLDPSGLPPAARQTALARLSRWTGERALIAAPAPGITTIEEIVAALSQSNTSPKAADFITAAAQQGYTHISGSADYPLFDIPAYRGNPGHGEILMQTLASGTVIIEDYDRAASPLWFGETKSRSVPPGEYLVSMIYRNGTRETKRATVSTGKSVWVVFNYVPNIHTWDFKDGLPSFGVYIGELDPNNYQTADPAVLAAMGMEAHTIAILAGNNHYNAGDYDKAITEYTTAIRQKPDNADAYARRGNAWRKNGNTARAIADYTQALAYKSNYPEVYNYRGYLYAQQDDYRRAIADYTRAIQQRPTYGDALFNRAYAHAKTGDHTKAIDDYTRVLALEPANAYALTERARSWLILGDTAKAEADFIAASTQ